MLTIYTYAKCSTCRDAVKWLQAHKLAFDERPIRETPPSLSELRQMLATYDGQLRKLFNSSGLVYRAQKLSERLPAMTEKAALELLTLNGSLVKRPFVISKNAAIVGFDPETWSERLIGKE